MEKQSIKTFNYEGNAITFNAGDGVMVNATEMAKVFGKRPIDWLQNKQTEEFLSELSKVRKSTLADLVQVTKGGDNPGTWMHEDVALEFARWLSPKFAIWCNDRIKELLTQGVSTISNDDEAILHAMQVLQKRIEDNKALLQAKDEQIEAQEKEIKKLSPMADYTKEVLQSTDTYTLTQVAKYLGFSSVYKLTDWLHDNHVLYRQSGVWMPTDKYSGKGIFATRTAKFFRSNGEIGTTMSTVVTEKGRAWLHTVLQRHPLK